MFNLNLFLLLFFFFITIFSQEQKLLNKDEYNKVNKLYAPNNGELELLNKCLEDWPDNPFKDIKSEKIKLIGAKVQVLGIGSDIEDKDKTSYPQLVLIKPNVNVLTSAKMNLLNPNGWYCIKTSVTVLSKTSINLDCKAHIATTKEKVTVMGSNNANEREGGGVTVLGKLKINKVNCQ